MSGKGHLPIQFGSRCVSLDEQQKTPYCLVASFNFSDSDSTFVLPRLMLPPMIDIKASLRRSPLLAELDEASIEILATTAVVMRFGPREIIVQRNEPGDRMYVLMSGHVKIVMSDDNGRDTVLGLMGPGEALGEISLFTGKPSTATAVTLEATEAVVLPKTAVLDLFRTHPEAAIKMLEVLANRLQRLSERSEDLAFLRIGERLAKRIVGLADDYGQPRPDGSIRLSIKLSQQEIGDLVNATRESVNKHIKSWEDQGLLRNEAGYLVILNSSKLRKLIG